MTRLDNEAESQIAMKAVEAERRGELTGPRTFHWTVRDKDMHRYKVRVRIVPVDDMTLDIDYAVEPSGSGIGRRFIHAEL